MKPEKFLEAMNEIDDKYIEEVRNYKMKKRFPIKRTIAAAACAALVIGTFPLVNHFTSTPAGTGTTGGIIDAGTTGGTEDTLPTVIKLGESGEFTVWEPGVHASDPNLLHLNAEHNVEERIVTNIEWFVDSSLKGTTKTIEFNGKSWTGTYERSTNRPYYGSDTDTYVYKVNGKSLYDFEINRETGAVEWFYNSEYETMKETSTPLTQDECYKKAIDFLKTIITDIEEYELDNVAIPTWGGEYDFTWFRKVNGIKVSDYISVGITTSGDIYMYSVKGYGSMDNVDLSAINMTALLKIIGTKVNTIYANNFEINHTPDRIILVRLDDGTFYFNCHIAVTGKITADSETVQDMCYFHAIMN